jgi:pilus assembly protein FimV
LLEPEVDTLALDETDETDETDDAYEAAPTPMQPPKVSNRDREVRASAGASQRPAPAADALEGADIYIAYGRFGEAAAALRKALKAQPERNDLRFRLLEVLAQQGDVQGFAEEEAIFRAGDQEPSTVDELKARYPQLSSEAPVDQLEDAVLEFEEAPTQQTDSEQSEDFQLNLDDLSLDADWDLVTAFESPASKKAAEGEKDHELADAEQLADTEDLGSPFAASMLVEEAPAEDWLQDELAESFRSQPPAAESPLLVELDHLESDRESLAKLNQALAYIEQGSIDSACGILNEVISEGDEEQKQQARELLAKIA